MYTMMSRGKDPPQADFFVIPRFGNAFLCKESMCFLIKNLKFFRLRRAEKTLVGPTQPW